MGSYMTTVRHLLVWFIHVGYDWAMVWTLRELLHRSPAGEWLFTLCRNVAKVPLHRDSTASDAVFSRPVSGRMVRPVDCWRKKPEKDEQAWGRRRGKGKLGLFILPLLSKMQYPSSNRVQGLIVILKLKETVSVSCTRQYFVSGSESHSKIIHIMWYVLYKDEGRPIAWLDEEGPRRRQTDRRLYCVWNGLGMAFCSTRVRFSDSSQRWGWLESTRVRLES